MSAGIKWVFWMLCVTCWGCTGVGLPEPGDRPLFDNGVNVFEAQVIDGQTGAPIPGATVSVQVGRHELAAESVDGFFTVYGIPYGTFRVLASAEGYGRFVAMKSFTNSSIFASLIDRDPLVYYFNNIVMYPTGDVPADVTIAVYDGADGTPVVDATVAASLDSLSTLVNITDVLAPRVGLLPTTLLATTDASGRATFTVDSLIMGAVYSIDVFGALDANGVYLVPATNRTVRIGYDVQEVAVFLSRPFLTPVALLVNNEDPGLNNSLIVTFPYAIEICSDPAAHDWNNSTSGHPPNFLDDTDFDGIVTTPASSNPVAATLDTNGTVLTLDFSTETDDAGDGLWVRFTGVRVKPRGASDGSCTSLSSVSLRDTGGFGASVNTEIKVRDIP